MPWTFLLLGRQGDRVGDHRGPQLLDEVVPAVLVRVLLTLTPKAYAGTGVQAVHPNQ
ncbi:hypothetical protein [Streptomyces sp. NPDC005890]|uniref:hypothetical protein n=1 Tax=Streptomyces sp. NPDC005890 TaxID=3154568 RepID=UPI0033D9E38C